MIGVEASPVSLRRSRNGFIALYALTLVAVSVGLLRWVHGTEPWVTHLPVPWVVLGAGFFVAEATALHIEIRREAHSLSLSGLPLLLGILSVSPVTLVLVRLAGSALALAAVRRRTGLKLIWNLSLFAAETAAAIAVASFALSGGPPATILDWLLLLAAVLIAELIGLVAVPIVIMVAEGELRLPLFAQIGRSQLIAAVSSTFAMVVAGAMLYSLRLSVFAVMPVLGFAALLRLHGQLGKEHHDLQQLHGFTKAIGGRSSLDTGLRELCSILRIRGAAVAVLGEDDSFSVRAYIDDELISSTVTTSGFPIEASKNVIRVEPDTGSRALKAIVDELGGQRGLGLRVSKVTEEHRYIVVFDRLGATEHFGDDEVRLFGSMAATFGARLSADRLLERLEIQARIDPLTGLANRHTLELALDERLREAGRAGAVLLLDLDRFKDVNDSLGHQFGDQLLRTVAARLQNQVRDGDLAARLGGDEFAVIFDDFPSGEELERRVNDLAAHLGQPLDLDGITLELGVSIGMAHWPTDAESSVDLLRLADIAMYEAKRTHQQWVRYEPTIDHANADRLSLMGQLRDAIDTNQLEIYLQPQVLTSDLSLIGAEALLRWNHPVLGMVPPGEFLPLAEHSSIAGELTRHVLAATLEAGNLLREMNLDLVLSMNLTSRDLLDRTLTQVVSKALAAHGVPGNRIGFEVTESSLIVDIDTAIANLAALRELGCRTSVDDFGTGYASLQYIQRLPIDEVKIDQSFVAGAATNTNDEAIVRSTTRLMQDLGLEVVAEGVEDDATLELIRDIGCDITQGYLVSRPLPVAEFAAFAASLPGGVVPRPG